MSFEFFDHTADIGLAVEAEDKAAVFAEAAKGLFELLIGLDSIRTTDSFRMTISGTDDLELMAEWLTTLLFQFEVDEMVFAEFDVQYTEGLLTATVRGEKRSEQRHFPRTEVKAITYHGLEVTETSARIILDI